MCGVSVNTESTDTFDIDTDAECFSDISIGAFIVSVISSTDTIDAWVTSVAVEVSAQLTDTVHPYFRGSWVPPIEKSTNFFPLIFLRDLIEFVELSETMYLKIFLKPFSR